MDTSFEEKVVELDNNTNYYVIKQIISNGDIYLLANLLKDEETPSEDFSILKVINADKGLKMVLEEDEQKLEVLLQKFSEEI